VERYCHFLYALVLGTSLGCRVTEAKEVVHYGFTSEKDQRAVQIIDLKHIKTIDNLIDSIQSVVCDKERVKIKVETVQNIKYISINDFCRKNIIGRLFERGDPFVIRESQFVDLGYLYPIDQLNELMTTHHENYGASLIHSYSPSSANIRLRYRKSSIDQLTYVLDQVTKCFDELNYGVPLKIMIEKYLPPPPPPPKPNSH